MNYFEDPAVDKTMQVVLALAAEVWVLRDRVRALEEQLEAANLLDRASLDIVPEDEATIAARREERDHFISAILGPLL